METVRADAVAMLEEAFTSLTCERVIPCPASHPYVRVGRDYYGSDVMNGPGPPAPLASSISDEYPGKDD